MEQDDTMENSDVNNDSVPTYRSNYPDIRRYSIAPTSMMGMNTNKDDSDSDEKKDTKIEMPTSQPPQYSSAAQTMHVKESSDKKVKVCMIIIILLSIFDERVFCGDLVGWSFSKRIPSNGVIRNTFQLWDSILRRRVGS